MFGEPAALVSANMFMGLFGGDIGVRLPEDERERLMREDGAGPFAPPTAGWEGYAALPSEWLDRPDVAGRSIGRAFAHTAALPPKVPKATGKGPAG